MSRGWKLNWLLILMKWESNAENWKPKRDTLRSAIPDEVICHRRNGNLKHVSASGGISACEEWMIPEIKPPVKHAIHDSLVILRHPHFKKRISIKGISQCVNIRDTS
jgi:hypothetical protein